MSFKINILGVAFLFLFVSVIGQNQIVTIKVIDKEYENPVFGASIIVGDKEVGLTNTEGFYNLPFSNDDQNVTISFIGYKSQTKKISTVTSIPIIILEPNGIQLDEVVIGNSFDNETEDFLKQARKAFQEKNKTPPHWNRINIKKVIKIDNNPMNFTEIDGHLFMPASSWKVQFSGYFVIPSEVRRISDSPELLKVMSKSKRKFGDLQYDPNIIGDLHGFRVLQIAHPLSKRGKRHFQITKLREEELDGEHYVVFKYQQITKKLEIKTRDYNRFRGQFWLHKTSKTLYKEYCSFDFESIARYNIEVAHRDLGDKIYPSYIKLSNSRRSRDLNNKHLLQTTIFSFKNIDTIARPHYSWSVQSGLRIKSFKYNMEYWDYQPISKNYPFFKEISLLEKYRELKQKDLFIESTKNSIWNPPTQEYLESQKKIWEENLNHLQNDLNVKL